MPELPEVEIIVRGLKKEILGKKIQNVWTDFPKIIKKPKSFKKFKKEILNKKIEKIWRRGKNIILKIKKDGSLLPSYLLIHQKLTGHLLIGKWKLSTKVVLKNKINKKIKTWTPLVKGPLEDSANQFIHLNFWLDDKRMLALSDLRKFAKVEILSEKELEEAFNFLGPEPLEKNFTFEKFKNCFKNKKGKIKQVLMNQKIIVGIGNIYSDEILWKTKIHPFKDVSLLNEKEFKKIYYAMKEILLKAIKLGGTSISDFRQISGEKGYFQKERKAYGREGKKCNHCGKMIKRAKIINRSTYFCSNCQKL